MKPNNLLFCTALLAAPFCSSIANAADLAADKESPAAVELRLEAIADLQDAFDLTTAIENVDKDTTDDFAAANPMAETSIFKQMPNLLMARLKEVTEPGISETKATDALEAASAQEAEGFTSRNSIVISNT